MVFCVAAFWCFSADSMATLRVVFRFQVNHVNNMNEFKYFSHQKVLKVQIEHEFEGFLEIVKCLVISNRLEN